MDEGLVKVKVWYPNGESREGTFPFVEVEYNLESGLWDKAEVSSAQLPDLLFVYKAIAEGGWPREIIAAVNWEELDVLVEDLRARRDRLAESWLRTRPDREKQYKIGIYTAADYRLGASGEGELALLKPAYLVARLLDHIDSITCPLEEYREE